MSYYFDGASSLQSSASLTDLVNTSFTLVCWVNAADATPTGTHSPFSLGKSSSSSTEYVQLRLMETGNAGAMTVQGTAATVQTTDGEADAANNTWFLMAGLYTVNASNTVTQVAVWSYNGTAEATMNTVDITDRTMSTFNTNRIGQGRSTNWFLGKVAHCAIYKKLLSASELTELTTKAPNLVASSDLYVYWPLLENADAHASFGGSTFNMATQAGTPTLNSNDGPSIQTAAAAVKKLKLLAHSSAQGVSNIAGVVFEAPTGGAITGAKIGEFTSKAFDSSLESGKAVLKVPVADFGGSALTTSSTPVALVRNSTSTTGVVDCTVIEE